MCIRKIGIGALAVWLFALGNGCKKSEPSESQAGGAAKQPAANDPVATVHWIGMKRLSADTNAAGFLKIWRLPETEKVKAQTLDKLALAPWRLSGTNQPPAVTNYAALVRENPSASLLRPLLDDLVQEEWYLEIRDPKEKAGQIALAVRLHPERAGLWETNLGKAVESLTGTTRTALPSAGASHGWQFQVSSSSAAVWSLARRVELARAGEWTIIGLAPEQNAAFTDLLARAQGGQPLCASPATNDWLQTTFDLRRLAATFSWGWDLQPGWPRISLAFNGDGQNVVTRGRLNFPKPLPFEIEPWNIPTNLLHEPVHSFTAAQGLKSWLSSLPAWQNLHAGAPPNQLFCWAHGGSPFMTYAAAPLAEASTTMTKLGPAIMEDLNPLLATNRMGKWERAANSDGVVWNRVPIINPFVQSVGLTGGRFLFAGLSPLSLTNHPPPSGTLDELRGQPNLVYFDRELTGPRMEAWMFTSQLFRLILRSAQLPPEANVVAWLKVAGPMMGGSTTSATKTGPTELLLARTSTVGLTATEIHLLADWLESPQFPLRLHSIATKLPPPTPRRDRAASSSSH